MKFSHRLMINFFIVGLIGSIIGAGFYNYNHINELLTEQVYSHLETTAQSRAHHIETFLEEHKHMVELLAFSVEYSELDELIKIHSEFYEVFILDSNGKIIASSNELYVGLDKSTDDYFINARNKTYIKDAYYSETVKKRVLAISTPHLEGVLVARIKLNELNEITTDKTGLGETGEVYLINKEKFLITSSRFFENEIMVQEVKTENTEKCIEHYEKFYNPETKEIEEHENEEPIFLDYRGEDVLGTHYYIPEMQWCLLAEIDKSEALRIPRIKLISISLGVIIIITSIITLLGYGMGIFLDKRYKIKKKSFKQGRK